MYICKSKGIIHHTWQWIKHEGEEKKLKCGRLTAKITRNEKVIDNYRIFQVQELSRNQRHEISQGMKVILARRGCDELHSQIQSQLQNKEFQLTLSFRLGPTSPLLGKKFKDSSKTSRREGISQYLQVSTGQRDRNRY